MFRGVVMVAVGSTDQSASYTVLTTTTGCRQFNKLVAYDEQYGDVKVMDRMVI